MSDHVEIDKDARAKIEQVEVTFKNVIRKQKNRDLRKYRHQPCLARYSLLWTNSVKEFFDHNVKINAPALYRAGK